MERTQYVVKFEARSVIFAGMLLRLLVRMPQGIVDALDRTGSFTTQASCPSHLSFAMVHCNEPLLRMSGALAPSAADDADEKISLSPFDAVETGTRGDATELSVAGLSSLPASDKWRELWYAVQPPHAPYATIVHVGRQVDAVKHLEPGVLDDLLTRELEWGDHTVPDVEAVRADYWATVGATETSPPGSSAYDSSSTDGFLMNPFLVDTKESTTNTDGSERGGDTVPFVDTPSVVLEVLSRVQEAYRYGVVP